MLAALAEVSPGLSVEVLRAPTGELDARIATEQRTGGQLMQEGLSITILQRPSAPVVLYKKVR